MRIKNLKIGKRIASLAAAGIMLVTGNANALNNVASYDTLQQTYNTYLNQEYEFDYHDLNDRVTTTINTQKYDKNVTTIIYSTDYDEIHRIETQFFVDLDKVPNEWIESWYEADYEAKYEQGYIHTIKNDLSFLSSNKFSGIFSFDDLKELYYSRILMPSLPVKYYASESDIEEYTVQFNVTESNYNLGRDLSSNDLIRSNFTETNLGSEEIEVATSYNHEFDTGIIVTNFNLAFRLANYLIQNGDYRYLNYRIETTDIGNSDYTYHIYIDYNNKDEEIETKKEVVYTMEYQTTSKSGNLYNLSVTIPNIYYFHHYAHGNSVSYSCVTENGVKKIIRTPHFENMTNSEKEEYTSKYQGDTYTILEIKNDDITYTLNGKDILIPKLKTDDSSLTFDFDVLAESATSIPSNTYYLSENEITMLNAALKISNPFGVTLEVGEKYDGSTNANIFVNSEGVKVRRFYLSGFYDWNRTSSFIPFDKFSSQDKTLSPIEGFDVENAYGKAYSYSYTPVEGDIVLTYFDDISFNTWEDAVRYLSINMPNALYSSNQHVSLGSPFVSFEVVEKKGMEAVEAESGMRTTTVYPRLIGNETYTDQKSTKKQKLNITFKNTGTDFYYSTISNIRKFEESLPEDYNVVSADVKNTVVLSDGSLVAVDDKQENGYEPNYYKGDKIQTDEEVVQTLEDGLVCDSYTDSEDTEYSTLTLREDGLGAFYYRFDDYYEGAISGSRVYTQDDTSNWQERYTDSNGRQYEFNIYYSRTDNVYDENTGEWGTELVESYSDKTFVFPSAKDLLEDYEYRHEALKFKGKKTEIDADDFLIGTFGCELGEGCLVGKTYEEACALMEPRIKEWAKSHIVNMDVKIEFVQEGNTVYAKVYGDAKGYNIKGTYTCPKDIYVYSATYHNRTFDWANFKRVYDYSKLETYEFSYEYYYKATYDGDKYFVKMTVIVPKDIEAALASLSKDLVDTYYMEMPLGTETYYKVTFVPTKEYIDSDNYTKTLK